MTRSSAAAASFKGDSDQDLPVRGRVSDHGRLYKWRGGLTMVAFFGGMGLWGALAPLESAAILPATVQVENNRRTLDHPDGGEVAALLVDEGDTVAAGQVLIRLDTAELEAELEILSRRLDAELVRAARAVADQADDAQIAFPPPLLDRAGDDPELAALMRTQERLHRRGREALRGEIDIRTRQIGRFADQIAGRRAQLDSVDRRRAIIGDELDAMRRLRDQELVPLGRVLALERRQAELDGEYGSLAAAISEAETAIGQTELEVAQIRRRRAAEIEAELEKAFETRLDLEPRVRDAARKIARASLKAPTSGVVLGLRKFTIGGVVRPGEPLLDIVPENADLIVEARIPPTEIDDVRVGMAANVRFLGLSFRDADLAPGVLTLVSPDVVVDEATRETFYRAEISVPAAALAERGIALQPGMPAEALVPLGSRTAMAYLLEPLLHTVEHAMRER